MEQETNQNWMEDKLNEFYNGAVDNCIEIVKQYHDRNFYNTIQDSLQALTHSLSGLKKQTQTTDNKFTHQP